MNDTERLVKYDHVIRIIEDQLALEQHTMRENYSRSYDAIQFSRWDAYRHIVKVLIGIDILDKSLVKNDSPEG